MKFETTPQLFVTIEEYKILDQAMELCKNMDEITTEESCYCCPKRNDCGYAIKECMFSNAYKTLKEIIDIVKIK